MSKTIIKKIGGKLYGWAMVEKRIRWTRKIYHLVLKMAGKKGAYLIDKQKRKYYYAKIRQDGSKNLEDDSLFFVGEKPLDRYEPWVSVIVPNYNHGQFLRERLETIYNQTYNKYDVILLDDASSDNSILIMQEYCDKYPEKTQLVINEKNSGNVFLQWAKGLKRAKGDIVWIAESDDFCELNFLETLLPTFRYQSVRLAFTQSYFMEGDRQIWTTQEYLSDMATLNLERNCIMSAHDLVQNGFAVHNVIANVSSALIRNYDGISERLLQLSAGMKLSGDWIFYLDLIRGGTVAYSVGTVNYYRIHESSTSLKVQETETYYKEFEKVSCYVAENYKIDEKVFEKVLENLQEHYAHRVDKKVSLVVTECYSLDKIFRCMKRRNPNIAMVCYALKSGGGEIYPLYLANEMRKRGVNVSIINLRIEPTQEECKEIVATGVPIIEVAELGYVKSVIEKLGLDLVHSHHANVDEILATIKNGTTVEFAHVVTLHGLYEMIDVDRRVQIMEEVCKECSKFIYIAEKNKKPFIEKNFYKAEQFIKIPNGLPDMSFTKLTRQELGIKEDMFVITLASRAIPDKGWQQAVEAVEIIRESYSHKVVLFLLGEGEERQRLLHRQSTNIRMPGNCSCVRAYFEISDVSLLPSVYAGESLPLVVIESLLVGTPVLATDVGEIRSQLLDEEGKLAGELIPVKDGKVDAQELAETILKYVNAPNLVNELKNRTHSAVKKFNFDYIVDKHIKLYEEILI